MKKFFAIFSFFLIIFAPSLSYGRQIYEVPKSSIISITESGEYHFSGETPRIVIMADNVSLIADNEAIIQTQSGEIGILANGVQNLAVKGFIFTGTGIPVETSNVSGFTAEKNWIFGFEPDLDTVRELRSIPLSQVDFSYFINTANIPLIKAPTLSFHLPDQLIIRRIYTKTQNILQNFDTFLNAFTPPATIENCVETGICGGSGFFVRDSANLSFKNNVIYRMDAPFDVIGAKNLTITENMIMESIAKSLTIADASGVISNNFLSPWLDAGGFGCNAGETDCALEIKNNTVLIPRVYSFISGELFYFTGDGWQTSGDTPNVHHNIFLNATGLVEDGSIDNVMTPAGGWPLRGNILESGSIYFHHNTLYGPFDPAVQTCCGDSPIIENNQIFLSGRGIALWGDSEGTVDAEVKNNLLLGSSDGILLENAISPYLKNNIITQFSNTGIRISGSSGVEIIKNSIDHGPTGVHIMNGSSGIFKGGAITYCGIGVNGTAEELANFVFENVYFENNGSNFP